MQSMGMVARGSRILVALGIIISVTACGGGTPAIPTPNPASDSQGVEVPSVAVQTSDQAPAINPNAFVFGVDLDTIQAGAFDQGKMWTFEAPPCLLYTSDAADE